ncbi:DNA (cytosine-5)-methyltransferase CMT3-like [Andrographis paniculata]|uniref:DNA (cytosine-5)-methyltransferase CMT3-like n=1 Tax=Andrographis paniculata TaxID=175694 RepID=UPI0021E81688|nr:DNA (cytosine-5)-methyltransferase CMT3-like [Andrographis paniculata]
MKKQRKPERGSPSECSPPRLSAASSSARISEHSKSGIGSRSEDAWALSLEVAEPQPLQIRHPSDDEDNPLPRSSPRLSYDKFTSPIPKSNRRQTAVTALTPSQLRRSPRLSSISLSPAALTPRVERNAVSCDKESTKRRRSLEDKDSRAPKVVKKAKVDSECRVLRSSLRLSGGKIDDSNLQLVALLNSGSKHQCRGSLREKCLRSRTVLVFVGEDEKNHSKKNGGGSLNESVGKKALKSAPGRVHSKRESDSSYLKFYVSKKKQKAEKSASTEGDNDLENNGRNSISQEKEVPLIDYHPEASASKNDGNGVKSMEKCSDTPKKKSTLKERNNLSERKEGKKCDLELTNVKCLRSKKIQVKGNVEGVAKKKKDSVEGSNGSVDGSNSKNRVKSPKQEENIICCFVGEPVPEEVAHNRWQWRYELKSKNEGQRWKINADEEDEIILNVKCHYSRAKVGNCLLDIGDCVFVKGEGTKQHVGRILEFFKTTDEEDYFRIQWFFRAEDTVLKDVASCQDNKRLFYSTIMNDNPLDCIISKVTIERVPPKLCMDSELSPSDSFYYDMEYCVDYSTFRTLKPETSSESDPHSLSSKHPDEKPLTMTPLAANLQSNNESSKPELALLDIYSGCGGMSTGLCAGAKLSGINLVTKWAVDYSSSACDSLKLNHPETQVRNVTADDFLDLLREWEKLCKQHVHDPDSASDSKTAFEGESECQLEEESCTTKSDTEDSDEEYEVSHFLDICYGDPTESGTRGLHFKVRWKGYDSDEDSWEPVEGLGNCEERIEEFVRKGFESKILPLPGDVDVICGGPPCQGISGYNRHRNFVSPLTDERNRQIIVFMNIVEFLKPKYVLMENVVDIIRFDKGSLGRYALSRLVHMKYQARLGTMASGCYGLPQFRLRVFIWGAHPAEMLPQYPLPTHDVIVRYWPPLEFERNVVAYEEGQPRNLHEAVILRDSISDLPAVANDQQLEETAYTDPPKTEFQASIRSPKDDETAALTVLYDHRPLELSKHDYLRVCHVPHRKGANFRDFPGVIVGGNNIVRPDPAMTPVMLPTGRPLVPDSVYTFEGGKSKRPYARVWWDETVSTVVTYPHIRAQAWLHPEQDRCLTIRECARLQGFPDYYRFCGSVKDRYCQVGNAVSIPVARALGYALGMAFQRVIGDEPLMILPPEYSSRPPPPPAEAE